MPQPQTPMPMPAQDGEGEETTTTTPPRKHDREEEEEDGDEPPPKVAAWEDAVSDADDEASHLESLGDVLLIEEPGWNAGIGDISDRKAAEVYALPKLAPGREQSWALDLQAGWDFNRKADRRAAIRKMTEGRPRLLVASSACTTFAMLRKWKRSKMVKSEADRCWKEAVRHVNFTMELCKIQHDAGRLFIFEQPLQATSWELRAVKQVMRIAGVLTVKAGQCRLGLLTRGAEGQLTAVNEPTRFMTNSPSIAAYLDVKCDGDHMHRSLLAGRARGAQVYPTELRHAICKGLVDHLAWEAAEKVNAAHHRWGCQVMGELGEARRSAQGLMNIDPDIDLLEMEDIGDWGLIAASAETKNDEEALPLLLADDDDDDAMRYDRIQVFHEHSGADAICYDRIQVFDEHSGADAICYDRIPVFDEHSGGHNDDAADDRQRGQG